MKRDLDLIRLILLDIETPRDGVPHHAGFGHLAEKGHDPETIQYHVQLMHDAGLIVADELVPGQWWPERITWAGHEFLDLARDDARWEEAKQDINRRVGSAPFQMLRDLLARSVGEQLAPPPRTRKK